MEKMEAIRTGYAALLFAFASIAPASANPVITTFDVPGSASTYPMAIAGSRIAGWYADGGGSYHGFVRKANGQIETFDVSAAVATIANCINASGEVAGIYANSDNTQHGFVRDPGGTITPFDPPNTGGLVEVGGINSSGAVSGDDGNNNSTTEFFIRDPAGNFTTFAGDQSATYRVAGGINDAGYMVGTLRKIGSNDTAKGFVRDPNGNITRFDVPGDTFTFAVAIDQNGTVAGSYTYPFQNLGYVRHSNGNFETFSFTGTSIYNGTVTGSFQNAQGRFVSVIRAPNGATTTFHVPGASATLSAGIWNGKVTGRYYLSSSNTVAHGFLRTP